MTWNTDQLAQLAQQYERIGYVAGERWPAPPDWAGPNELLAMLREIPDHGGRAGYMTALAKLTRP